jgi:hypothetical protein
MTPTPEQAAALVKRLRCCTLYDGGGEASDVTDAAADLIEAQAAAIAELVGALRFYADEASWWDDAVSVNSQELFDVPMGADLGSKARAAIAKHANPQEVKP